MSEVLKGFIPLEPKPLQRHRQGRGCNYDPSKADKKRFAEMCIIIVGRPEFPPEVDVVLSCRFVLSERSKQSWPDLSNLVKFVEDALEGAYYKNDRQICAYGDITREFTCDPEKVGTHLEIIYEGD